MSYRVLITDYVWPDLDVERRVLGEIGTELVVAPDGEEETLVRLAQGVDAILTCWARTTSRVMDASENLKVVVRYGVGLDNIDVAHATSRGIPVANVADYCSIDVAEHTMALMLSAACKVTVFDRTIRSGAWDIQQGLPLRRLHGQTLGLIGIGKIGQQVARRALVFGLRVLATSPSLTPERAASLGVEYRRFDDLLSESDIVSVHCPSTDTTRGLLDAAALDKMKPTAFLINTSRGDLVDETALADALESGRLAGAALDVRAQEPPAGNDRLTALPNVTHTPHAAFYTTESLHELQEQAAWEARRALSGEEPVSVVNPGYKGNQPGKT